MRSWPLCRAPCGSPRTRWRWVFLSALILCLVLIQQLPGTLQQSATFDEVYHISAGYALWRSEKMPWLREEHTPLLRQLVALPLLLLHPQLPQDATNRGDLAHRFFFDNVVAPDTMLFWARLPVVALTMLLVLGVQSWAQELWGLRAGLLAGLVAALDPNLIAHGQLATSDVGVTCFFFLALYAFWRLLRRPSRGHLVVTGLAVGLALASKFSAVLIVPVLALSGFLYLVNRGAERTRHDGRRLLGWLLVIGLLALAVLVVDYGGEFRPVWDMALEMQASEQGSVTPPNSGALVDFVLTRLPIPLPSYWYGLWLVQRDVQGGRPVFLWGQHSSGWWYYFPVVLLIKTPLATLILVGVALTLLLRSGLRNRYGLLFLILPVAVWLGIAMTSRLNLGYRHILPIWPFLFVAVGSLAAVPPIGWRQVALLALVGWLAVSAITIFPHHLAYFNELVGGPGEGYRYLVDSNLDWGQDLKGLARYQREHALGKIYLAYFGTADPDYYGIEYECMPSYGLLACDDAPIPRSGILAVSATCLQGGCTGDPQAYRWLLDETPVAKIGYSIFVYELP